MISVLEQFQFAIVLYHDLFVHVEQAICTLQSVDKVLHHNVATCRWCWDSNTYWTVAMERSVQHPSCCFTHIMPPFSFVQPFNKAERIAQNMLSHHANVLILLCSGLSQTLPSGCCCNTNLLVQLPVWS